MSLSFSQVLSVLSLFVSTIALMGVYFNWSNMRQTRMWNKVKSIVDFADAERLERLRDDADEQMKRLDIVLAPNTHLPESQITEEDADKILRDPEVEKAVMRLLGYFERLSAVINLGAVDEELAYQFFVGEIMKSYSGFRRFIIRRRQQFRGDEEIMQELEKLATRWIEKKQARMAETRKQPTKNIANRGLKRQL